MGKQTNFNDGWFFQKKPERIVLIDMIAHCITALLINAVILLVLGLVIHADVIPVILLMTGMMCLIILLNMMIQSIFIGQISVEKILRS